VTTEDAYATWQLLSAREQDFLRKLARQKDNTVTPQQLAREMNITWQAAASTARALKRLGLVTVKSLPKLTCYTVSGQGEAVLAASARPQERQA